MIFFLRTLLPTALLAGVSLGAVSAQSLLPALQQTPAALRWYEVRTPHFRVLYPAGFADRARRTAHRLEQVHEPAGASLGIAARPVTVVLQTRNTIGNGFVTLLPRHSEFFTTFPQDPYLVGTLDWLDQLTVHEYRHVVQYDKARQGSGLIGYALGGYGGLGLTTLGVPDWFAEGDAVGTETALTRSGRGRIPNFDAYLRANLLAGRRYTYAKAVGGSYRDYVPNHYVLGYFLTTSLKRTAGPGVWGNVLNRYYRFPVYPFSFSDKLRLTTGLRTDDLYQRTMQELDSTWRTQQARRELTLATQLPVASSEKIFTEYQYPQYLDNNTVLALKSGLGHTPRLVELRRGGLERELLVLGLNNNPEQLSAGGGRAAWLEFRYHPRWQQQVYSELRILDLATGRLSRPGRRTRYSAAVLSPDGQRLLAVSTDSAYQHRLQLLDAATGATLRTYPNPQNEPYLHPRFGADGRTAALVRLEPAGKRLELLEVETGQARTVLPAANDNLSHPQPWQDYVLFNSPRSGQDEVYAVRISTGEVRQVTARSVGAYHATVAPDGQRLAFHEVQAQGSRVLEMLLTPDQWRPVAATAGNLTNAYADVLAAQEPGARTVGSILPTDSVAGVPLTEHRYRRLPHALNLYGWGLVQSPTGTGLNLGLRAQDVLSTTQVVTGVGYDATERTGRVFADASYQGLGPILDLGIEHGGRRAIGPVAPDEFADDRWQYTRLSVGSRLPLVLTTSRMLTAFTAGAYYQLEQTQGYNFLVPPGRTEVGSQPLHALLGSLSFSRTLRQSYRDVAPRWGQSVSMVWRGTPFGKGISAEQRAVQASLFLPGIGWHHAVRLRAGYQWQQQQQYRFGAAIFYPRSLPYLSYNQLTSYSAEYRLPLADVHWEWGRALYVQRLKGAVFADGVRGESGPLRKSYYATGFDVSAVFNPLRLRTPLELGIRTVYNSFDQRWQVQPLLLNIGF
ncbi:TolB family protein [Hymenobacter tenuis]